MNSMYILIRSRNALPYLHRCLDSALSQTYDNFTILFVDDSSNYSRKEKNEIQQKLKGHICVFNSEQKFAVRNAYEMIHEYAKDGIIVNLDGDDWFADQFVLQKVNDTYKAIPDCWFTYGNCYYYSPGQPEHLKLGTEVSPFINRRYSDHIAKQKLYREEPFYPLHLRTWKVEKFKKIPKKDFLRPDKSWIKFCEDQVIFYPLLEAAQGKYFVITEPLYYYNRETSLNDSKVNLSEMLFDEVLIRRS